MSATKLGCRALSGQRWGATKAITRMFSSPALSQARGCIPKITPSRSVDCTSVRRPIPSEFRLSAPSKYGRRQFSVTSAASHGHWEPPKEGEEVYITFVDKEGDEQKLAVNIGDNLLTIAQGNDIEMEGACEGSCSCSTCHVIVENEEMFDKIPEATDDENDMLDLAFGLTETSRLGCQIVMSKELDGLRVKLPSMTRNLQASDFTKKS